jgi:hypothetical protein
MSQMSSRQMMRGFFIMVEKCDSREMADAPMDPPAVFVTGRDMRIRTEARDVAIAVLDGAKRVTKDPIRLAKACESAMGANCPFTGADRMEFERTFRTEVSEQIDLLIA